MKIFSYLNSLGMLALLMTSVLTLGFTNEAYALSCPNSRVPQAGLCYDPPQANHTCSGISCAENCPSGYSPSTNNFCHYTAGGTTYTEKPYTKKNSSHPRKCGALYYSNCRKEYYMNACGICSFGGKWDVTRHTYTRSAGVNPDVSAAFNDIGSTATKTWQQSLTGAEAAYNTVQSEINAVIDAAQLEIFRVAGNAAIDKQKDFLLQLSANFEKLQQDPDAVNIMKRLVIRSANKDFGPDSQAEMLSIGEKLGLIQGRSNSIITNQPHAAWGIYGGAGAAYYAGAEQTIGMVANTYKDNGQPYGIGGVFSTGGLLGIDDAIGQQVGIFWQPNGIDSVKGGFVGLKLAADAGMGGEIGLQWAISQGMKGASAAIPGFYLAYGSGMSLGVALKGGYSYLAK
jgi:hypothetical protein